MKLTPIERELLLHRLELDDCIAECIATTRLLDLNLSDEEYERRSGEIGEAVSKQCRYLYECVSKGFIPSAPAGLVHEDVLAMHKQWADILEDACDGSTFFANERDDTDAGPKFGGHARSWWARRHAAADSLEAKLTEYCGRKVTFARY